ncbi:gliding motility-associated C-terminal domain-containing protein [Flagellimonas sp. DF-77]|uniref:T9SS type B sorting domain-containing protein n=1 Tax=Flagellimonas algarum TaxID=3230298 RepID=UPI00339B3792
MRSIVFLIALGFAFPGFGQALHNSGMLRLHDNAQIGLHTDLINNGPLEADTGSVFGFYGTEQSLVTGALVPQLYDIELLNGQGVVLQTGLRTTNNFNFILGRIFTPKDNAGVFLEFNDQAFYVGDNDENHVDGFVAITDKREFTFPVGAAGQIRSLYIESSGNNAFSSCAYFFEDPSNPVSINTNFDTETKVRDIGMVSNNEFWVLTGGVSSQVTVSWNTNSGLANIANEADDIVLVGWSKSNNQWVLLGKSSLVGDVNEGFLISDSFVPDDFAAITFGTVPLPLDTFAVNNPTLGNYFMSPNGDGINENLIFDNIEGTGRNQVAIFTRTGQKVFEQTDYTNEFTGVANVNGVVLNREIGLPEGIYYYTISLLDEELEYQGFVFIDR